MAKSFRFETDYQESSNKDSILRNRRMAAREKETRRAEVFLSEDETPSPKEAFGGYRGR